MATHANSTTAPARTLLRSGGAPCLALTTADMLRAVGRGQPARIVLTADQALVALSAAVDRAFVEARP